MRKSALLSIFVLLLGYWAYIPTFWFPEFASVAYLKFPWIIHGICILLHVGLIMMHSRWSKWLVLMAHVGLFFATPFMRDSANWVTIKVNESRSVEEFSSPYPGYKLVLPDNDQYLINGDAMFIYGDYGWTFEALVFHRNHGLEPNQLEQFDFPAKRNASVEKVYNKDWYKYSFY